MWPCPKLPDLFNYFSVCNIEKQGLGSGYEVMIIVYRLHCTSKNVGREWQIDFFAGIWQEVSHISRDQPWPRCEACLSARSGPLWSSCRHWRLRLRSQVLGFCRYGLVLSIVQNHPTLWEVCVAQLKQRGIIFYFCVSFFLSLQSSDLLTAVQHDWRLHIGCIW